MNSIFRLLTGIVPRRVAAARFLMIADVSQRTIVFRHPHEVNREFGWSNLLMPSELLQRQHSFHQAAGAGSVVSGAPLGMVEVSADQNFPLRVFPAADVSMHQSEFART